MRRQRSFGSGPSSKSSNETFMELLEIGKIMRAHGIAGRMKVLSYLESSEDLNDLPEVSIGRNVQEITAFPVESVQPGKGSFVLKLGGIEDRDAAEQWRGASVWMAADRMKPLPEGEYYWRDIIGLQAETEEGESLGRIAGVFPTGGHDVYICRSGKKELLIPAVGEVVRKIDLDRKRIVIRLPKGLAES